MTSLTKMKDRPHSSLRIKLIKQKDTNIFLYLHIEIIRNQQKQIIKILNHRLHVFLALYRDTFSHIALLTFGVRRWKS